ncbi:MAG TPA: M24 family metallopeptidase [Acidimicrobiia bacterium]|nr:M24 family metallopeptidase [Acidimicrobiia bacterium]
MVRHEVEGLLVYGADRSGSAVQWLTQWPVTREAAVVVTPGQRDSMFVQFYNHVPAARRFALGTDVSWGGTVTVDAVAAELRGRGVRRLGIIGPLGWVSHGRLAEGFSTVSLDSEYTRLRLIKSAPELEWLRRGAELSDRAIEAVREGVAVGIRETELGALCEESFLATGATNHIHYFGVTNMAASDRCVPSQWPSTRRIDRGDVVTCEISVAWWGYAGQVLRSITVAAEPDPLYRELHAVADAAYEAICGVLRHGAEPSAVIEAAGVIEDAGFTIYDDLVHGYGGGYLPPSSARPAA